jgi:hypothetical protein
LINELNNISLKVEFYPFGMLSKSYENGYRFGFNGQEKDDKVYGNGNSYTAEFWQYDTRLGRRWNLDPKPNPWSSSYAVFNNNPIFYMDLFGDTVKGDLKAYNTYKSAIKSQINNLNTQIGNLNNRISKRMAAGKNVNRLNNKLTRLQSSKGTYTSILKELSTLESSTQVYNIVTGISTSNGANGFINFDYTTGNVNVNVGSSSSNQLATIAHELKHAYQFETGRLSLAYGGSGGASLYDLQDEMEAYKRGQLFGYPSYTTNVTTTWIQNLTRPNGKPAYPGLSTNQLTTSSPYINLATGTKTTYGLEIKQQLYNFGTIGHSPIQVIKGWQIYYNQGTSRQPFKP